MKKQFLFFLSTILVLGVLLLTQCSKSSSDAVIPPVQNPNLIKLATSATLGSYLTDKDGNALYFFSLDANGNNNCTGGCATAWPIFNVTGLTQERLGAGLQLSDFSTIATVNGTQVTFKGWPLYYYAPGGVRESANLTSGEGVNGVWFVAKTDYTIMIAKSQLVGADGKNYIVGAGNLYTEGVGLTTYFTDLAGRTLYGFSKDSSNMNKYTKADFSNNPTWPIYETDQVVVPSILDKTMFGSITVFGKKQLTFNGWPMYYFGSDVDGTGAFRGNNKGVSVPKPNVWPVMQQSSPAAPKPQTPYIY
jgi:predicted lipoprotein with Yx(FWY)xxD motif